GPFTWTRPGLMATFTPLGSSIGCFPIRLNGFSFWWKCAALSPDKADNFAADALLLGGAARDQAVGGGQDRDAHAAEHAGQPVLACVDAASRLRDALQVSDHPLAAAAELEVDDERLVRAVIVLVRMRIVPRVRRLDVVVADVALLLEQAGDLLFYPRVRHLDAVVQRSVCVADPAEHVCDGVSQHRLLLYLPSEAIGTNQLDGKCGALFIVTTRNSSSCRGSSRRARARAGRFGRGRTCGTRRAGGRSGGTACSCAP